MFRIECQGAVEVVSTNVPLNHESAADLSKTMLTERLGGKPMLVLDMTDVSLIDSAGLDVLLEIQDALQDRGGTVKLAAASPLCREILRITGVDEHFDLYTDVKTAVGSFVQ